MTLSKKDDLGRKWRSFRQHLMFIMQPICVASVGVFVWLLLWNSGIHFSHADEAVLSGAIIPVLGIAFSILAAAILPVILAKYAEITKSVLRRDKDTFLLYRDERLPIIVHLVLGALAVALITMVMLVEYHEKYCGFCSVFVVTFCISLYLFVAAELQDPTESVWFAERIPSDWLTADVDEHFKLGKGE